jgi:hypothetical protein
MLEKDVLGTVMDGKVIYRERKVPDSAANQAGLFISVNTICADFRSYNERLITGQGSDCSFLVSQQMGTHFFTLHMECNVPYNAWQPS